MTPKVPTKETGTAMLGMMVAYRLRRKRKMTITTRTTVSINSNAASEIEALIAVVRSVSGVTSIEAGRLASSWGRIALMAFTTLMVLAPGCLCILRMTAGVSFIHAARKRRDRQPLRP